LGGILGYQLADDPFQLTTAADAAAPALSQLADGSTGPLDQPLPAPILAPSPEAISVIRERPLFVEERSPVMLAQETTSSTTDTGGEQQLPEVELAGTLLSERSKVALVVNGDQQPSRMRVGETIADWQIKRIDRDRFLLERDGQVEPLLLRDRQ
jgi:type II secretory pathway component PulC